MDEWSRWLKLDTNEEMRRRVRRGSSFGQEVNLPPQGSVDSRRSGRWTTPRTSSFAGEQIFGWFHLQMAFATSLHKQYYGTKVSIRFARAFEPSGKKGLVSAKVKGSCFHDFEETLKELVTAHFLCQVYRLGVCFYCSPGGAVPRTCCCRDTSQEMPGLPGKTFASGPVSPISKHERTQRALGTHFLYRTPSSVPHVTVHGHGGYPKPLGKENAKPGNRSATVRLVSFRTRAIVVHDWPQARLAAR
jgi:hypothetical protein